MLRFSCARRVIRPSTVLAAQDEDGQALVEYGLLAALIAAVAAAAVATFGTSVLGLYQKVADGLGSLGF